MISHTRLFTLSRMLSIVLLALSLASCGQASTGSNSNMTLKVAQVTNGFAFLPLYVAEQEGFFKAQGLTLDPSPPPLLNSGSKLAQAVEANSAEVGIGGTTDVYTISRVDSYVQMIGAVATGIFLDIVVSKRFEQQAHVTAASSLADKVKALVGKKIGVSAPNSATDALVTYLFRQQGFDVQTDATKVYVGAAIGPVLSALSSGRVDAAAITTPGAQEAETRGYGDNFISPIRGDDPTLVGELFNVAYARQQTITAKPNAIRAFIRGLAQAEAFIHQQPARTLVLLRKYLAGSIDQKTLDTAWNATKSGIPADPQICHQAYEAADQFHLKGGLIAIPLAYKDLVAQDIINQALGLKAATC
jgi:NitT/TauT family transport system substrate-binding protein